MTWHPDPITGEPVMHLGKGYGGDIYLSELDDEWWPDDEVDADNGHAIAPSSERDSGSYPQPGGSVPDGHSQT